MQPDVENCTIASYQDQIGIDALSLHGNFHTAGGSPGVAVGEDNQAYMNTGVQKSGSTPFMARTKTTLGGRLGRVKNIEQIVAAHGDIYIATASSAYPEDLLRKVRKAKVT